MKIGNKILTKSDIFRWSVFITLQLFNIGSAIYFFAVGANGKAGMCFTSMVYTCLPLIIEKLFRFRIQNSLYVFIMIYTVCPMIGFSYKMYYAVKWWDDLMHGFAGVIFAMFGAHLGVILNKGKTRVALCAILALTFSMGISVLWEFAEFSMDTLFGADMQKDTLLTTMRPSYLLGELLGLDMGKLAELGKITEVTINGQVLTGYVDIGLLDTMLDMFVETSGALLYTVAYVIGKGKRFTFVPVPKKIKTAEVAAEETPLAEAAVADADNE